MRKPNSPQVTQKEHKNHRDICDFCVFFVSLVVKNCRLLLLPAACCLLISAYCFAQRPKLKPMNREYFAGRFLLIPRDNRPSSLQQPRMIAAVADHDIIAPPARLLGDAEKLIAWAQELDYDGIDGAIVSLDAFSGKGQGAEPLELLRIIRARRPGIPIYGFINFSSSLTERVIDEMGSARLIDLLALSSSYQPSLEDKIASRRLLNRIIFSDDPGSAAISLLVRMINQRFGFAPRILPVFSSSSGRDAAVAGRSISLQKLVSEKIKKSGGLEVRQNSEGARSVEVILFIHTAQARDSDRNALIDAITQTVDKNVRVALVDLTGQRESGDAIIAELRRRKLLDRLAAFAASDGTNESPGDAIDRAIAQASSYMAAIRFLRDDLDRVRRIDRAQIALLLGRYLSDWAFPFHIRPNIQPGLSREAAEAIVLKQVKPLADEIFEEQFRRNAHSYLLSFGERADFEVRLLQRLLVGLYPSASGNFEVEIRPSIYLFHHGNEIVLQLRTQKNWELFSEDLDKRVERRWKATDWPIFKTDAQSVEMTIKVDSPAAVTPETQQSYSIISKRSRDNRRIEIAATTPRGAFYALGTLELLGADGQLGRDYQLNETPAVAERGIIESSAHWSHLDRIEMLRFLGRNRMNRYYYLQKFEAEESSDEKIQELLRAADDNFVQLIPGFSLGFTNSDYNDSNFAAITRRLDRLAALGVRRFVIGVDNKHEKSSSNNTVSAQARFISRIREHLKRTGNYELALWQKSPASAEYLQELSAAIPPDVEFLRPVTAGGVAEISNSNRPRKVFDPGEQLCLGPGNGNYQIAGENSAVSLVAATDQVQFTKLIAAKASEIAWNGSKYEAGRALNSALNLLYDERSREGVRAWLEHFEDCRTRINENTRDLNERNLTDLQYALESISGTRERGLLRGELAQFIYRVREVQSGKGTRKEE
jgi:hypothetical protein